MGEIEESGLEVSPCTGPQVIPQPDANKYFLKAEESKNHSLHPPIHSGSIQSDPSDIRNQDWRKAFWVLALISVFLLAAGLGAGLGAGLAAQRRSAHLSGSVASSPVAISLVVSSPVVNNPLITTTQSGKVITTTSVPSSPPTIPSPACPAADRSTYIATNKPSPTASPELEISNTSLAYEIFCYTNFIANPPVLDLQTMTNVTSLVDCMNACALYSFQTKPVDFPAFACTGVAWERDAGAMQLCWLKRNITSSSANATDIDPGIDGAVMVFA